MKRYSVTRRLFVQIILTVVIGALVVTSIDLVGQYRLARRLQSRDEALIEENVVPVLSYMLWVLNEEQVKLLVGSLVERPEIVAVEIELEDGTLRFGGPEDERSAARSQQRVSWSLSYARAGQEVPLGRLTVVFAPAVQCAFGTRPFTAGLLPDLAALFVIVVFVGLSLRRRVAAPLRALERDIDAVDFTEPMPEWWTRGELEDPADETRTVRRVLSEAARLVRQEINERLETERELAASLDEKSVLLKEVHHRVKNNLQIVVSLLALQRGAVGSPEAHEALRDSENRVTSMSMVHELLYREDLYSTVDLRAYLGELAGAIVLQDGQSDRQISVTYDLVSRHVDLATAVPLGLITTELLTNAVKHAFRGRARGTITLSNRQVTGGGKMVLSVCDDGAGLPADWKDRRAGSLGFQIVHTLCSQIDADLSVEFGHEGTCMAVAIPE